MGGLLDVEYGVCGIGGILRFCSVANEPFILREGDITWRYPVSHIICKDLRLCQRIQKMWN